MNEFAKTYQLNILWTLVKQKYFSFCFNTLYFSWQTSCTFLGLPEQRPFSGL